MLVASSILALRFLRRRRRGPATDHSVLLAVLRSDAPLSSSERGLLEKFLSGGLDPAISFSLRRRIPATGKDPRSRSEGICWELSLRLL